MFHGSNASNQTYVCIYYRDVVTKGENSCHDKLQRPQSLVICSESVSSIDSCHSDQTKDTGVNDQMDVSEKAHDSETRDRNRIEDEKTNFIEKKNHCHHDQWTKAINDSTKENIWRSTEHIPCRAGINERSLETKIYKDPPNMRCNGVELNKKFRIGNVREILLSIVNSIL